MPASVGRNSLKRTHAETETPSSSSSTSTNFRASDSHPLQSIEDVNESYDDPEKHDDQSGANQRLQDMEDADAEDQLLTAQLILSAEFNHLSPEERKALQEDVIDKSLDTDQTLPDEYASLEAATSEFRKTHSLAKSTTASNSSRINGYTRFWMSHSRLKDGDWGYDDVQNPNLPNVR